MILGIFLTSSSGWTQILLFLIFFIFISFWLIHVQCNVLVGWQVVASRACLIGEWNEVHCTVVIVTDVPLFYCTILSVLAIFMCKEMYSWDELLCYVNLGDVLCDVIWWMILIRLGVFLIWIWNSVGFNIGQIIGLKRPNK